MKVKGGGKKKNVAGASSEGLEDDPTTPVGNGGEAEGGPLEEKEVEEAEEGEEADEDDDEDEDDAEGEADEEGAERPKLDEGFYEIEAVRRKRVRKGQVQYLIKWRGWPETANTWEPVENLMSCSDVIEAFEESLRSGKQRSSRKRKRKYGAPHAQAKKKPQNQQHRAPSAAYSSGGAETSSIDEPPTSSAPKILSFADLSNPAQAVGSGFNGEINLDRNGFETDQQVAQNGLTYGLQQPVQREELEYDPKLSELRATACSNGVDQDNLAVNFREPKAIGSTGPTTGVHNTDSLDPGQSNRNTGAKRRKSGSVKRFKQELASGGSAAENAICSSEQQGFGNPDFSRNESCLIKSSVSNSDPVITKIIKPIGFSASVSNNIQDVSVTFMVMRSDGKEVMVDNRFLKENCPLLLIDFYEQHLRYSPTS
ncbi:chromo domain-containing protein LHP1 [Rhodamnia argentea]|uniref:Chromo domain-containing protein LHP1 n=1 Tax=Rhodamnia argentea TaxID=178133 RepID=A0A8B8N131_9MYRT|nr:chromo domain-containing protein LHP1 [Rhodamnia argentea]XP_048132015.1 chromo domain-containing protein LHP1 [Rhodamnia argentea]XP_048132016.1 chromo domain-containing protein LHP1 [Rhodamnia argentea]